METKKPNLDGNRDQDVEKEENEPVLSEGDDNEDLEDSGNSPILKQVRNASLKNSVLESSVTRNWSFLSRFQHLKDGAAKMGQDREDSSCFWTAMPASKPTGIANDQNRDRTQMHEKIDRQLVDSFWRSASMYPAQGELEDDDVFACIVCVLEQSSKLDIFSNLLVDSRRAYCLVVPNFVASNDVFVLW